MKSDSVSINPVTFSLYQSSASHKRDLVNKSEDRLTYTVGEIFNASLTDKIQDWVLALRLTVSYIQYFNPHAPEAVVTFGVQMGDFKNFLSFRKLYGATQAVYDSVFKIMNEPIEKSAIAVFVASTQLMASIVDSLRFMSRFVVIDASTLNFIAKNTDMAKLACVLLSAGKHVGDFSAAMADPKSSEALVIANLLALAIDMSYIALGVVSIGFSAAGLAPSAIVLTTCSAVATVLSFVSYFQEKMCDPYQKNSDVNWKAFQHRVCISA